MADAPLANVRILDLSRLFPGPQLTKILGDLGAEVIKIESPQAPDTVRHLPPFTESGQSAAHVALSSGKQSVAINLKQADGRAVLLQMVRRADVVVESYRPGVLERLGIAYATLKQVNPAIILCSVTGYGQNGPLRDAPGHDLNYMARAGLLALGGPAGQAPAVPGVQVADFAGGALGGVAGVLAALYERTQTGQGRHIDLAMTRSVAGLGAVALAQRVAGDREPRGAGMLTGGRPAYRLYATADGRFMALAALEPKFFAAFCERAGCPHLADKGWTTGAEGAAVTAELEALFHTKTQAEWRALLAGTDACCEPVQTPEEALADPELGLAAANVQGVPVLRADVGFAVSESLGPAAQLGADSENVAAALGVEPELLERARAAGAFGVAGGTT